MTATYPRAWPTGDGEMAARIRALDWDTSPLGPPDVWPHDLRFAVDMMLAHAFPVCILWGPEFIVLYNDLYPLFYGNRHPAVVGQPNFQVWPEAREQVEPVLRKVWAGETVKLERALITDLLHRDMSDAWYDASLSPLRDEKGDTVGILMTAFDVTERVMAEREREEASAVLRASEERQAFLLRLSDAMRPLMDANAIKNAAARLLGEHLGAGRCGYAEFPTPNEIEIVGDWTDGASASLAGRHRFNDFGVGVAETLKAGGTLRIDDTQVDDRSKVANAAYEGIGVRSVLAVPLVKNGYLVIAFFVQDANPRRWTDLEEALLREVAERTWAAVERARAEAALRESEALRAIALAGGRMGTWRWDLAGRQVWGDAHFLSLWGFPSTDDAIPLERFTERMTAAGAAEMEVIVTRAIDADEEFDGSLEVASGPTGGRWVRWRGRAAADRTMLYGVSFDITDQKHAEARLRESEARNRLLIGSWAQAVWETDANGVVVADSPSWRAYTGQRLDEWLGHGWLDAVHPDDRAYAALRWREAIAARGLVDAEFRLRVRDGGWRWTNIRAAPVLDAQGRVVKWAGMNIDVHERKLARQALNASELFSRALVEGVPQLIWRAVDGGDWTWASPQWTTFTGQPEPDTHAHGWLEPVHPDDREEAMRMWQEAEATGRLEMDLRLRQAATGTYRWFQARAIPVRAADDTIIEWLGTSTDVDDLRRLQDRQQILVAELQHRVRNILTVVRSVFTRTAEADTPLEQVVEHFRGRLDNLARTQVVVTQSASGAVDLHNLIFDELLSVGFAESPNVTLDGPDVTLDPTTAESIGLAIHELTTNAIKYGALKVAGATLQVRWSINLDYGERRTLHLTWLEQGVPAIPLKPSRQGFGSELIEEALPYRLGAETKLEFRGGGVRCTISVPLSDETAPTEAWETA